MKAEIEKILEIVVASKYNYVDPRVKKRNIDQATSSLTSLIIKWLESKKVNFVPEDNEFPSIANSKIGRNQLITELVEELK